MTAHRLDPHAQSVDSYFDAHPDGHGGGHGRRCGGQTRAVWTPLATLPAITSCPQPPRGNDRHELTLAFALPDPSATDLPRRVLRRRESLQGKRRLPPPRFVDY